MNFSSDIKLGILGGGQLGRMLIQQAINYNIHTLVLDGDANAPCKDICHEFQHGKLMDYDTVLEFGKRADVITIEFEHVNVPAMETLRDMGKKVYPQPEVLKIVQDKGLQKQFYADNGIPTAPFRLIASEDELSEHIDFLPVFQKSRTAGYDGKGVYRLDDASSFKNALKGPAVLEKLIPFEKELAVIVARNESGNVKCFPMVEMQFNPDANLVELLFSPARVSQEIEAKAEEIARKVATTLGIVGILAVELFLTKEGEILVNEIAPRPHNSGHHTIEANLTSQYDQHLRSIFNFPLGHTALKMPAAMINLLGEQGHQGLAKYDGMDKALSIDGVFIHLYGKLETKPFRKMGHVTVLAKELDDAVNKAQKVKDTIKVIA